MTICGIYKITSPSERVYIGQSWDIESRWLDYTPGRCKNQPKIRNSLLKYGKENHRFEILHILPKDVSQELLDEYEIFYINKYKESGASLLNLKDGGSFGKHSESSKLKMSASQTGKKQSKETIEKRRIKNLGKKRTQEFKDTLRKIRLENPIRGGEKNRGIVRTQENKDKISKSLIERIDNKGESHPMAKLTEKIVLEIRSKYKPYKYTLGMLVKEYKLSRTHIKDIIKRKVWRHI
jgi:group I intron endonuclease